MRETLLATILMGSLFVALAPAATTASASSAATADVTLRVAPTYAEEASPSTGYVIPSEHVYAKAAETLAEDAIREATNEDEDVPETTSPAVWLRDPATNQAFNDQVGVAGCTFEVQDGGDQGATIEGYEVLDQAADRGCLTGWAFDIAFGDPVVTMVDDLWKSNETGADQFGYPFGWWQIQKNGHIAGDGIGDVQLEDGDSLGLVFMRHA